MSAKFEQVKGWITEGGIPGYNRQILFCWATLKGTVNNDNKYYIAYGSNLSIEQMEKRTPDAIIVGEWNFVRLAVII